MATRVDVITECDYCGTTSEDVEERSARIDKRVPQVADACDSCWAEKSAEIAAVMAPGRSKTVADREAAKIKRLVASLGTRTRGTARNGAATEAAPATQAPSKKAPAKKATVKTTAKKAAAKRPARRQPPQSRRA